MPGVYVRIQNYMNELENSPKIKNFIQGTLWKDLRQEFDGKIVLPLHLHFDDYEPDNSLGSHHTEHALGALCATIPCLPPEFQSSLDNIFSLTLYVSTGSPLGIE